MFLRYTPTALYFGPFDLVSSTKESGETYPSIHETTAQVILGTVCYVKSVDFSKGKHEVESFIYPLEFFQKSV